MYPLLSLIILILSKLATTDGLIQNNDTFLQNLNITVNDSIIHLDSAFTNQIQKKLKIQKFNYTISGISYVPDAAYTIVRIPQTFNRNQVIGQCILYYYSLSDEKARMREQLQVYPFFEPIGPNPNITSRYNGYGRLKITIRKWNTIPFPERPSKFEADIYNQIMDLIFDQAQIFGPPDRDIFEKIGKLKGMETDTVIDIYKRVLLWQKSQ